jgi:hypothetical protein
MNSVNAKTIGRCLSLFLAVVLGGDAFGYVPILTTNDNLVRWQLDERSEDQPNVIEGSVEFFTHRLGTADIDDEGDGTGGEFEIFRQAFRAWEKISTSDIDFNDLKLTHQTLLSPLDMTNFIAFDENNDTGFFPLGTGIIALTLLTYDDEQYEGRFDGRIRDADLVFNGQDFVFGANGEADRMDLLAVATHEVGHICGLSHNFFQHTDEETKGLTVPTMYPYLGYGDTQVRTLELDDIAGVTALYTNDERNDRVNGSISGKVTAQIAGKAVNAATPLFGVDIVAYKDDIPVVGTISRTDGVYRIFGVPAGTYTLRCHPISPYNVNLSQSIDVNVQSQFYPAAGISSDASAITVAAGRRRFDFNFSLPSATAPDFFEPNDSSRGATLLETDGRRMIHQFFQPLDEDWVQFQASAGMIYDLVTDNLSFFADPLMELYSADGITLLARHDDLNAGLNNVAARIRFTATNSGTHFVRLIDATGFYGWGTAFEFSVTEVGVSSQFDSNGDGVVNALDLLALGSRWQSTSKDAKSNEWRVDGSLLLDVLQVLKAEN